MATEISNSQDIIDSRDVIARLEELRDERTDLETAVTEAQEALTVEPAEDEDTEEERKTRLSEAELSLEEWDDDNGDELKALEALNEEGEQNAGDWTDGAALIRESYFVEFCKYDVRELGYLPQDAPWWLEIDWEKTADHLRQDYSEVTFDGETYLVRD